MDAFKRENIIEDMSIDMPEHLLKITYGDQKIEPGTVITPTQAQHRPQLEWPAAPDAFYTLIMNDPDAPSRETPTYREWHHWMIGNIPGCDVQQGEILSDYVGAGPPPDTGLHRYVFLVYKQEKKEDFSGVSHLTNTSQAGRPSHKAANFVKQWNLQGPTAGNFFQAEYDDYCPKLYKQLSL